MRSRDVPRSAGETAMPAWKTLPTPAEIVQHLDRFVRGQARAKRDLASCVYRHYLALAYGENHPGSLSPFGKRHVLLLGPTGAGKTLLVTTLAEHLGVPVAFGSAASLVENGYVGEHLESVFRRLLSATRGSTELAERGIVFLDEIDKVRRQEVNSRDVAGEGVQTSLLAPLDGCPVEVRFDSVSGCTLNTSRMLFICTGAFSGLPELIRRRISAGSTFGFRVCEEDPLALSDDELLARGELQDLEAYGFIPEFLGRFAVISTVTSLSRDDLVGILRDTEESPLVRQRRWFAQHGVELLLSDDAFDAIVDLAIRNRTNARGLERILAKMLATLDFQLPELAASGVSSIRMDRKALLGQGEPLIRRGGSAMRDTATAANALRTQVAGLLAGDGCSAPARAKNVSAKAPVGHGRPVSRPPSQRPRQLQLPFEDPPSPSDIPF